MEKKKSPATCVVPFMSLYQLCVGVWAQLSRPLGCPLRFRRQRFGDTKKLNLLGINSGPFRSGLVLLMSWLPGKLVLPFLRVSLCGWIGSFHLQSFMMLISHSSCGKKAKQAIIGKPPCKQTLTTLHNIWQLGWNFADCGFPQFWTWSLQIQTWVNVTWCLSDEGPYSPCLGGWWE